MTTAQLPGQKVVLADPILTQLISMATLHPSSGQRLRNWEFAFKRKVRQPELGTISNQREPGLTWCTQQCPRRRCTPPPPRQAGFSSLSACQPAPIAAFIEAVYVDTDLCPRVEIEDSRGGARRGLWTRYGGLTGE